MTSTRGGRGPDRLNADDRQAPGLDPPAARALRTFFAAVVVRRDPRGFSLPFPRAAGHKRRGGAEKEYRGEKEK